MFHFNSLSFAVLLAVVAFSSAAPFINLNGALTAALNPVGALSDGLSVAAGVANGITATAANALVNLGATAVSGLDGLGGVVGGNAAFNGGLNAGFHA